MNLSSLSTYFKYISLGLVILVLGILSFFLYSNFYETITQAKTIYVLKSQVSLQTINLNLYQQIKTNIENKKTATSLDGLTNPFDAPVAPQKEKNPQTPPKP